MESYSKRPIRVNVYQQQARVMCNEKRFRVLVAGRRFGKTQIALLELFRAVFQQGNKTAWYVAPTYKQAKRIAWRRLKELVRPYRGARISETDLRIDLPWGSTLALRGADNYDSLRGEGLDFVVLDEFGSMSSQAWTEVLRPMLSDRRGNALFIGTPNGYNHFYEIYDHALQHGEEDWAAFHFSTGEGGYVTEEELQAVARELDERTYRQEFEASFEHLGSGRVYYAFDRQANLTSLRFLSGNPIFWSMDFNVNPMSSVIGQVVNGVVHVLEEIVLPHSHTMAACEAFLRRIETWPLYTGQELWVYGDATGERRQSSGSQTDWQLVKACLARLAGRFKISYRYTHSNPLIKNRVNCLNAALRNQAGEHRLFIDSRCKELVRDFEEVSWRLDAHGNTLPDLDKSDPKRTHLSDALGYMTAGLFSMREAGGFRSERLN
jgi:Terminase large subunit, T4likevirus-type, N-terminal